MLVSCLFVKLVGAFWCFEYCVAFAVLFVPCLSYLWISVCWRVLGGFGDCAADGAGSLVICV